MRYPEFLQKQGTIGFVAPSFGCATEPYKSAFVNSLKKWEELGYFVDLGPNCYKDAGIGISNTPILCGEELTEYYLREENDVLISCGGGELMCEILPYVDFEKLKQAKPKWYMGFSDNTNFTFLSTTICDTAAIYGPCAAAFGMEPWHASLVDAHNILTGKQLSVANYPLWEKEGKKDEEHPLLPYEVTEQPTIRAYGGKSAAATGDEEPARIEQVGIEGRLIGGCMDCLVNLLGTKFDHVEEFKARYQGEKQLWFLESCDLNPMAIRRAIWQMKHAGWFDNAAGFLIGRPLCYGEEMFGIDHYRAVTDLLMEFEVPILMDLDIGHLPPMMPIISGAWATATLEKDYFTLDYALR